VTERRHTLRVYRGDAEDGRLVDYEVPVAEGMVVLDALHWIQAHESGDLAVRWNCKAAKCGSCSVEINGMPALACKTRMDAYRFDEPIQVRPMKAFPLVKDLVTNVQWNYDRQKSIPPFTPSVKDASAEEPWTVHQEDINRVYEFRKCIECFLCQDVCHVIRDHKKDRFIGPAMITRAAAYDMHPKDTINRSEYLKDEAEIGYCNITKCCTEVCPEHIKITDNAIIPLKERVAADFYDPLTWLWRKITGKKRGEHAPMPEG
jgi:succinate dehydrogenase / fumarate reductase iron-sulfur subunit